MFKCITPTTCVIVIYFGLGVNYVRGKEERGGLRRAPSSPKKKGREE
jgi:hypothetical protein